LQIFRLLFDKDGSYSETEALVNVAVARDGKKVEVVGVW